MNLSFNNLSELDEFLRWANNYRADWSQSAAPPWLGSSAASGAGSGSIGDGPLPVIDGVAFDTPPALGEPDTRMPPPVTGDPNGAALQPAAEPPKRKRRTKAEIEADEQAARDAATAPKEGAQEQPAGGDAPQGANPFEQAAEGGEKDPTGDDAGADEGEAGDTVVTPFQHLTRAREFIAKHGLPKYNESFTKAGLDANVMGYSAYQRGVHMTTLDELEKA